MGALIDLTGQQYGYWTVVSCAERRDARGAVFWNCRCVCGVERIVSSDRLRKGDTASCGCARRIDRSGQKYHRWGWTVISFAGLRNGRDHWNCLCNCGVQAVVSNRDLCNSGGCGCSTINCADCGTCFTGGPRRLYCDSCKRERIIRTRGPAYHRAYLEIRRLRRKLDEQFNEHFLAQRRRERRKSHLRHPEKRRLQLQKWKLKRQALLQAIKELGLLPSYPTEPIETMAGPKNSGRRKSLRDTAVIQAARELGLIQ